MHVRLNMDIMESHPKLYVSRDEALRELKKISALRDIITKDDIRIKKLCIMLAVATNKSAGITAIIAQTLKRRISSRSL